jgi:hypothetical protein
MKVLLWQELFKVYWYCSKCTHCVCRLLKVCGKHHLCLLVTWSAWKTPTMFFSYWVCLENNYFACQLLGMLGKHQVCLENTHNVLIGY